MISKRFFKLLISVRGLIILKARKIFNPEHKEFGDELYEKEELIAELTSAPVAQYYGFDTHIKEDSAAYLKSWLQNLKEDAKFIRTVLLDVKRAAAMITKKIDEIKIEIAKAA